MRCEWAVLKRLRSRRALRRIGLGLLLSGLVFSVEGRAHAQAPPRPSSGSGAALLGQLDGGIGIVATDGDQLYVRRGQRIANYRSGDEPGLELLARSDLLPAMPSDMAAAGGLVVASLPGDDRWPARWPSTLAVISTTQAGRLETLASVDLIGGRAAAVEMLDPMRLVVSESGRLQVFDLTRPEAPELLSEYGSDRGSCSGLVVDGSRIFLPCGNRVEVLRLDAGGAPERESLLFARFEIVGLAVIDDRVAAVTRQEAECGELACFRFELEWGQLPRAGDARAFDRRFDLLASDYRDLLDLALTPGGVFVLSASRGLGLMPSAWLGEAEDPAWIWPAIRGQHLLALDDGMRLAVADAGLGLQIYDVRDPACLYRLTATAPDLAHPFNLSLESDRAYVLSGLPGPGPGFDLEGQPVTLGFVDLRDPQQPSVKATWPLNVRSGSLTSSAEVVYVETDGDQLEAFDAADLNAPRRLSRLPLGLQVTAMDAADDLLVVGGHRSALGTGRLIAFDIADPRRPQRILELGLGATPLALRVDRGLVYAQLHYTDGVRAILLSLGLIDLRQRDELPAIQSYYELGGTSGLAIEGDVLASSSGLMDVGQVDQVELLAGGGPGGFDVAIDGGRHFAAGSRGVIVSDIAEPTQPEWMTGRLELGSTAYRIVARDGLLAVAGGESGLWLYGLEALGAPPLPSPRASLVPREADISIFLPLQLQRAAGACPDLGLSMLRGGWANCR